MPKKGYNQYLTHSEVIELFNKGKYLVDPDNGLILLGRTKKPLYTFPGGYKAGRIFIPNDNRRWLRLYDLPKMISLPRSHAVWLAIAQIPIPKGFEIHHRNRNENDDRWDNLFCLFNKDHRKLHNGHPDLIENEEVDF